MVQKIKKHLCEIPKNNEFTFIGEKTFEYKDTQGHFEIFFREEFSSDDSNQFTFILCDITRTRIREKNKAELKYKSVFFSKVAHEFKNPLICITELVNRLGEKETFASNKDKKIMNQIKSMSNFMLVLIKDLNYFSESQVGKETNIDEKEVLLEDILSFCAEVTETLINKRNRSNSIKFNVIKPREIHSLFIDEWKIKQVLINLLSNAVKFTIMGEIKLEAKLKIENENSKMLQFLVSDTGEGITDENKENIFKPFSKFQIKNNEIGSGLGLFIVKEICQIIGGVVDFQSKSNEGSTFSVTLPYKTTHEKPTIIISSLEQPCILSTKDYTLDPLSKLSSHLQNSQAESSQESPKSGKSDTATTKIEFIPAQMFNRDCIIKLKSPDEFYNSNGKVFNII
jgi:signal transduction histidine kinase